MITGVVRSEVHPAPRYSEASLVRELEERGIGRTSTYAEIISKVQARDYVEKIDGARFRPTTLGKFVVDGLVRSELDFMDPAFTSKMEEELDEVEAGKEQRVDLLKRFYKRFRMQLDKSKKGKRWNPDPEPTDEKCELCGGTILKRLSKNGWFLGCANYPECKSTRDLGADGTPMQPRETGIDCDKCGKPMVIRNGSFGKILCTAIGVRTPVCPAGQVPRGGDPTRSVLGSAAVGVLRMPNYADESPARFQTRQQPQNHARAWRNLVMGGTRVADDRVREQAVRYKRQVGGEPPRAGRSESLPASPSSLRALCFEKVVPGEDWEWQHPWLAARYTSATTSSSWRAVARRRSSTRSSIRARSSFRQAGPARFARWATGPPRPTRARLADLDLTAATALEAAAAAKPAVARAYARGPTVRSIVDWLEAIELFEGGTFDAATGRYAGTWLDLPALAADVDAPNASALMQGLHLGALLAELGDAERSFLPPLK